MHLVLNWVFKYNTLFCVVLLVTLVGLPATNVSGQHNLVAMTSAAQTIVCADLLAVACFVYYMNVPGFQKVWYRFLVMDRPFV